MMFVSSSVGLYSPMTCIRAQERDYPMLPARFYPHDYYPGNPSFGEGKPRSSFFISDILYPSVIPLPGTLPTVSPEQNSPSRRGRSPSPASPRSSSPNLPTKHRSCPQTHSAQKGQQVAENKNSPPVRSIDLKFGIEKILRCSENDKSKEDIERKGSSECEKRGFLPISSSLASEFQSGGVPGVVHAPACGVLYSHVGLSPYHTPHLHSGLAPASNLSDSRFVTGQNEYPGALATGSTPPHGQPTRSSQPYQAKRARALSVALWPTVRFHHGPYSVLGSGADNSSQTSQPKRKRSWSRAVFSNLQRKGLEKRFEVQKYVTKPDRRQVASMLGLTDAQVKVWFQNRRMKWRHQEEAKRKKEDEEKKKQDVTEKHTEEQAKRKECPTVHKLVKVTDTSGASGEPRQANKLSTIDYKLSTREECPRKESQLSDEENKSQHEIMIT